MTSKIEWLKSADGRPGYTINPVKGLCPMACPYCYARRMYKRFKWNPEIRFDNRAFGILEQIKKPSRIFIGSTMELFGEWVGADAANYILRQVRNFPQHTFIFLTKNPAGLAAWSPFPDNCWVGVSATNYESFSVGWDDLSHIQSPVKFISFEPLLSMDWTAPNIQYWLITGGINWLIIGQQTPVKASTSPKIEWVKEIVEAADKAGVPVFLKNNLNALLAMGGRLSGMGMLPQWAHQKRYGKPSPVNNDLRQEFPW